MKLQGNRILISRPESKSEQGVIIPEGLKENHEKDLMFKYSKLDVFAVGEECKKVKAGDKVYVGKALEHSEIIEIEGKLYFMLNEMTVSIIW